MISRVTVNSKITKVLKELQLNSIDPDKLIQTDVNNCVSFILNHASSEGYESSKHLFFDKTNFFYNNLNQNEDLHCIDQDERVKIYVPLSFILFYFYNSFSSSNKYKECYEYVFQEVLNLLNNINIFEGTEAYILIYCFTYFEILSCYLDTYDVFSDKAMSMYDCINTEDIIDYFYNKNEGNLDWDDKFDLNNVEHLLDLISTEDLNINFFNFDIENFVNSLVRFGIFNVEKFNSHIDKIIAKCDLNTLSECTISDISCVYAHSLKDNNLYILVDSTSQQFSSFVNNQNEWNKFLKQLYYKDLELSVNQNYSYIIFVIDEKSINIPIQLIESNKSFGRKYVFLDDEAITFINGINIIDTKNINISNPLKEWSEILTDAGLSACMTEQYFAKHVDSYINGNDFNTNTIIDTNLKKVESIIPQIKWIKSLDTKGFRDYCFDNYKFNFGQINLFVGSNGSGKTSVLEGIEYALTGKIRRINDFVKFNAYSSPQVEVYDHQAGIHRFNPKFSSDNSKEIEKVWYGVPAGRTKTTLNENFSRFNQFDSEAAYQFVHNIDSSEDNFNLLFGNLLFGETVVNYEKKWQRFAKAFNEEYNKIKKEINIAETDKEIYESYIRIYKRETKKYEIEDLLSELNFIAENSLSRSSNRYIQLHRLININSFELEVLMNSKLNTMSYKDYKKNLKTAKKEYKSIKKQIKSIEDDLEKKLINKANLIDKIYSTTAQLELYNEKINKYQNSYKDWELRKSVLVDLETFKRIDYLNELNLSFDVKLDTISKIDKRVTISKYLKLRDNSLVDPELYATTSKALRISSSKKIDLLKEYEKLLENEDDTVKKLIQMKKIAYTFIIDNKCPLCGTSFEDIEELMNYIETNVVVNEDLNNLMIEINKLDKEISEYRKIIDRDTIIKDGQRYLPNFDIPLLNEYKNDYKYLSDFYCSKDLFLEQKAEIVDELNKLYDLGYAPTKVEYLKNYEKKDSVYNEFINSNYLDFLEFIQSNISFEQSEVTKLNSIVDELRLNKEKVEETIISLSSRLEALNMQESSLNYDELLDLEKAFDAFNVYFNLDKSGCHTIYEWSKTYNQLSKLLSMEVERIKTSDSVYLWQQNVLSLEKTIERLTTKSNRAYKAVIAFNKMQPLSSYVRFSITQNINSISKYFKWMHHSGEFLDLSVDANSIYAIRSYTNEKVRVYEMSTGQRTSVALAVLFSLFNASTTSPNILLLDEPLATMDDIQVMNVLDILESMAEQGTQIFFTSANSEMIKLFKECFRNTSFEYKEFEFLKRLKLPSLITEKNINDVPTINDLTLDDLVLDFNQFAQIRNVLRKNQERLIIDEGIEESLNVSIQITSKITTNESNDFISSLSVNEKEIVKILLLDYNENIKIILSKLEQYDNYNLIIENINEKAIDYFGEKIIDNSEDIPILEEDYRLEIGNMFCV